MIGELAAGLRFVLLDHLPFAVAVAGLDRLPRGFLHVDAVSPAPLQAFVHGGWLALDTDLGALLQDPGP